METKMLPIVKALSIALVGLVLVCCGKGSKDGGRAYSGASNTVASEENPNTTKPSSELPKEEKKTVTVAEFEELIGGVWEEKNKCYEYAAFRGIWNIRTLEYKDKKRVTVVQSFTDSGCQQIRSTSVIEDSFALGAVAPYLNVSMGFEIDHVHLSHKTTLNTQALVDEYNAKMQYGYGDWALNVTKDITGRGGLSPAGSLYYDVMAIVDGYLTFGSYESGDGQSSVTRPKELENDYFYIKK